MPNHILNEPAFMAGVALFDDLLREAECRAFGEDEAVRNSMFIDAEFRGGQPLSLFALPFLEALAHRPELAPGFAAALGDYVGMPLAPSGGAQYDGLTFDDFTRATPKVVRKVVPLFNSGGNATGGGRHG